MERDQKKLKEDEPPLGGITPEMYKSVKAYTVEDLQRDIQFIPGTGNAMIRIDLLKELIRMGIKNEEK